MRFPVFFVCWILFLTGVEVHGPMHLLLDSAAEIGFAWDGDSSQDVVWAYPAFSECSP